MLFHLQCAQIQYKYNRNYIRNYNRNYIINYNRNYIKNYNRNYNRNYIINYNRNYIKITIEITLDITIEITLDITIEITLDITIGGLESDKNGTAIWSREQHRKFYFLEYSKNTGCSLSKQTKQPIERWEFTKNNLSDVEISTSKMILEAYTDFPEIYNVTSSFCNSTIFQINISENFFV